MATDAENLARIETKLDTMIRLLALSVAPDTRSLRERAIVLQRAGLSPKDIAALCETTANTVSVVLSTEKRKKTRQKGNK